MASTTRTPRLLDTLRDQLEASDEALLCVAFASRSGVHLLGRQLDRLGPNCRLLVTSVFGSTTVDALATATDMGVDVRVLNPGGGTYHPKLYLGSAGDRATATVGSANLTGGLVGNIEVVVQLQGERTEPSLVEAWATGEELWDHPSVQRWTPDLEVGRATETLDAELLALLEAAVARDRIFRTLGSRPAPNTVVGVDPTGVWIETERTATQGKPAQLVPAWMVQLAWDHLRLTGELTNAYLLADDGLNVKRSSAVCALLARLPGVEAQGSPRITLRWTPATFNSPV